MVSRFRIKIWIDCSAKNDRIGWDHICSQTLEVFRGAIYLHGSLVDVHQFFLRYTVGQTLVMHWSDLIRGAYIFGPKMTFVFSWKQDLTWRHFQCGSVLTMSKQDTQFHFLFSCDFNIIVAWLFQWFCILFYKNYSEDIDVFQRRMCISS